MRFSAQATSGVPGTCPMPVSPSCAACTFGLPRRITVKRCGRVTFRSHRASAPRPGRGHASRVPHRRGDAVCGCRAEPKGPCADPPMAGTVPICSDARLRVALTVPRSARCHRPWAWTARIAAWLKPGAAWRRAQLPAPRGASLMPRRPVSAYAGFAGTSRVSISPALCDTAALCPRAVGSAGGSGSNGSGGGVQVGAEAGAAG